MIDGSIVTRCGCLIPLLVAGLLGRSLRAEDASSQPVGLAGPVPVGAKEEREAPGDAPRVAAASTEGIEHPLAPAIRIAQRSLIKLKSVADYEATLTKRELVEGRLVEQTMHLKLREEPLSVYLKYGEPFAGREVLFVQGENDGRLLTHEGSGLSSLAGTVSLDPQDPAAPGEGRHPITETGMRPMLEAVIAQWKRESPYGEIDVQFYPDAKLRGRPCEVIESSHPRPRRQFPFQKTRLYIDGETGLPVRFEQYGFADDRDQDPPLDTLSEYGNLRTNVGLTDEDFDRNNPSYSF